MFVSIILFILVISTISYTPHSTPFITRRRTLQIASLSIISTFSPLLSPALAKSTPPTYPTSSLLQIKRSCTALRSDAPSTQSSVDYNSLRSTLRSPPFDTLRKTMKTMSTSDQTLPYDDFIRSLEAYDGALGKMVKGGGYEKDEIKVVTTHTEVLKACENFYEKATGGGDTN